jgi:cytidylate kinase
MKTHQVVAIDGPAASGKSSVARELARRLGFVYVNTGAMYRAVTWIALRSGIDVADAKAVEALLEGSAMSFEVIDLGTHRESAIRVDGIDPAPHLSEPSVNANVSAIATIPKVRQALVARQRLYVRDNDLVMEGRDIGTVVFPETPLKFYIDASPEVRAQRRAAQGHQDDLAARDKTDSSRAHSPLAIAADAQVIDSSFLTIDGVAEEILRRLKKSGFPAGDPQPASPSF